MQQGTGGVRISFVRHAQFRRWPFVVVGILWGAFALVSIGSSVLFQVNAFRDQMPELKEMNFAEDFDTVDVNQLPLWMRRWPKAGG